VTETEWLACTDPAKMMGHLHANEENRSSGRGRKRHLFGCACGRRVVRLMSERGRNWLNLGERYADGLLDREQLVQLVMQEIDPVHGPNFDNRADMAAWWALGPDGIGDSAVAGIAAGEIENEARRQGAVYRTAVAAERKDQAAVLRDIFGNPFRPLAVDPSWLSWNDAVVVRLAQAAYEDRHMPEGTLDNGVLKILADAVAEAGCTDLDILNHCRQLGEHVRGCWVVDLILGKQ